MKASYGPPAGLHLPAVPRAQRLARSLLKCLAEGGIGSYDRLTQLQDLCVKHRFDLVNKKTLGFALSVFAPRKHQKEDTATLLGDRVPQNRVPLLSLLSGRQNKGFKANLTQMPTCSAAMLVMSAR